MVVNKPTNGDNYDQNDGNDQRADGEEEGRGEGRTAVWFGQHQARHHQRERDVGNARLDAECDRLVDGQSTDDECYEEADSVADQTDGRRASDESPVGDERNDPGVVRQDNDNEREARANKSNRPEDEVDQATRTRPFVAQHEGDDRWHEEDADEQIECEDGKSKNV